MGSGLSPNGLPFSEEGVVSLALLDKVKYLDLQRGQVTVEAGARIQPVGPWAPHCRPSCCQLACRGLMCVKIACRCPAVVLTRLALAENMCDRPFGVGTELRC